MLACKAINVAAPSGVQTSISLNVKCELNAVLATNKRYLISELVMFA
jgi:hypothetical protein